MPQEIWDHATCPFVVRWSHPTGDRLTRHTTTVETFSSEQAAIDAINRPFAANTTDAHVVRFDSRTSAPMIARRKRGRKLVRCK